MRPPRFSRSPTQATAFGLDAYPDVITKAAALLQSIVNNHSLVDGNKCLGWLATAVFLELNGFGASEITDDDVHDLLIWIASTNASLEDITTELSRLLARRRRRRRHPPICASEPCRFPREIHEPPARAPDVQRSVLLGQVTSRSNGSLRT